MAHHVRAAHPRASRECRGPARALCPRRAALSESPRGGGRHVHRRGCRVADSAWPAPARSRDRQLSARGCPHGCRPCSLAMRRNALDPGSRQGVGFRSDADDLCSPARAREAERQQRAEGRHRSPRCERRRWQALNISARRSPAEKPKRLGDHARTTCPLSYCVSRTASLDECDRLVRTKPHFRDALRTRSFS